MATWVCATHTHTHTHTHTYVQHQHTIAQVTERAARTAVETIQSLSRLICLCGRKSISLYVWPTYVHVTHLTFIRQVVACCSYILLLYCMHSHAIVVRPWYAVLTVSCAFLLSACAAMQWMLFLQ